MSLNITCLHRLKLIKRKTNTLLCLRNQLITTFSKDIT